MLESLGYIASGAKILRQPSSWQGFLIGMNRVDFINDGTISPPDENIIASIAKYLSQRGAQLTRAKNGYFNDWALRRAFLKLPILGRSDFLGSKRTPGAFSFRKVSRRVVMRSMM